MKERTRQRIIAMLRSGECTRHEPYLPGGKITTQVMINGSGFVVPENLVKFRKPGVRVIPVF